MMPNNPGDRRAQPIPVFLWNQTRADDAWRAYQAMRSTERADPALRENAAWAALVADAFEQFSLAFERA